jgi:hypothetical protein
MEARERNNKLKMAYRTLMTKVVHCINADDVLERLYAKAVLGAADYNELRSIANQLDKKRSLMTRLHDCGHPTAFIELHEAVKSEKAHRCLVEEIEKHCVTAGRKLFDILI